MSVIEKENFLSESSEQTKEEKKLESSDPVAASSSEELAKFGTPPSSPPREAVSVEDEPMVSTTITTVQVVIETELTMEVVESLPDELPTGEKADEEKEETVEEKKEEADEEEGEESDEDEEVEHAPPLFEQPLIVEGKRHRVTAQALQYASPVNTPKYKGGNGSELGNDPHFVEIVGKKTTDELKPLHKLLYGNPGKHATMKRELRRFSGFNFDEQSQEFAKKHKMLVGLKTKELGLIQSAFRKFYWPEDKKDRDAYATELLKLLLSPPDMTVSAKTPRDKASSQTPSRRKRAASGSQEAKTKRVRRSKKIAESEDESEEVSDQEEKEDESMDSGEEKIKEKKEPSSEELSASIGEIIKDADFTTMNTKGIIEQLAAKYPKMNVEKRRPEIKTIIKDTIQQHVPIEDEVE